MMKFFQHPLFMICFTYRAFWVDSIFQAFKSLPISQIPTSNIVVNTYTKTRVSCAKECVALLYCVIISYNKKNRHCIGISQYQSGTDSLDFQMFAPLGETECTIRGSFQDIAGLCVKVEQTPMIYALAEQHCIGLGMRLVVLVDMAQASTLRDAIGINTVWIGLSDRTSEGQAVWTDGTSFDSSKFSSATFDNLDPTAGDLADTLNADCMVLTNELLSTDTAIYDRSCSHEYKFVCEIDL